MFSRATNYISSFLVKTTLVLTSFAPVVFIFGISKAEYLCSWEPFITFSVFVSSIMIGICGLILFLLGYSPKKGIKIIELEHRGGDLVAYIYLLLLPFIRDSEASFGNLPLTTIACISILVLAITNIGLYYFNPIIRLFGYRVYSIKFGEKGREGTLIAKTKYALNSIDIGFYKTRVVSHIHSIYLYQEDERNNNV